MKSLEKLFLPFYLPAMLFIAHLYLVYCTSVYYKIPNIDVLMHFFGGFFIAIGANFAYLELMKEKKIKINNIYLVLFLSICCAVTAATVWEFAEFYSDSMFGSRMQMGLLDTMKDLFNGTVGGLAGSLVSLLFLYKGEK